VLSDEPYHTFKSHIAWHNLYYAVREDTVRYPDGSMGSYAVVEKAPAVYIVPLLDVAHMVLIHTYRYPLRRWQWEVPAGAVEPGSSLEESARAELLQEIGGRAETLLPIGSFATMPGFGVEQAHVFLAHQVTLSLPQLEASEAIERHIVPVKRALHMALYGQMEDGPSSLAVLRAAPYLSDGARLLREIAAEGPVQAG
jgi:ADP-ribose pyrophosphatase